MNHYQYKKILIIKHGSLGDVISSISAIRPIREFFKSSKIEILTTSNFSTFFSKSKLVDQNIIDNRKGILYSLKIIYIILSKKFDLRTLRPTRVAWLHGNRNFLPIFDWKKFTLRLSRIKLSWASNLLTRILNHFIPLCYPTYCSSQGKNHRKHRHGKAQSS